MNIYECNKFFLPNKYTKWYLKIIFRAQTENRIKTKENYFELHHILPQCWWPEYKKEKWNMVMLTPKEHWVCHRLLTKMTTGILKGKMKSAAIGMVRNTKNQNRYIPNSRVYDLVRKESAEAHSKRMKGRPKPLELRERWSKSRSGKTKSESHKQAIANALIGHPVSDLARKSISVAQKGRKHTVEHRAKNSAANSGEKNGMYGRKHSEETRAKIKASIAKRKEMLKQTSS